MPEPLPPPDVAALPPLRWHGAPVAASAVQDRLSITAPERTDWFVDPRSGEHTDSAPALLFDVAGDVALSARVAVTGSGTFDAAVLCLRSAADRWAKLCFERSPQGSMMVVSVVTRGRSDDANSVLVPGGLVHLRICRIGSAYAFHHSLDGRVWHFTRFFDLGDADAPAAFGFLAQAPVGGACEATFDAIELTEVVPTDLRDGT